MTYTVKKWSMTALVAISAFALLAGSARATFQIRMDEGADGSFEWTLDDNGSVTFDSTTIADTHPDIGAINVNAYEHNGWKIQVIAASSTSPGGHPPTIDILSFNVENVGAGNDADLVLEVSDIDFNVPASPIAVHALLNMAGITIPTGTSVKYTSYASDNNTTFQKDFATSTLSLATSDVVRTSAGPFTYTSAYSLTGRLVIVDLDQGQSLNVNVGKTWTTPEPASLAVFGSLFGLAGLWFRRRKRA